MYPCLFAVVVALTPLFVGTDSKSLTQQTGTPSQEPIELFSDPVLDAPIASTLDGRLDQVGAAIRCRVESSEVRTIVTPHPANVPTTGAGALADVPDPVTESTVTIFEVYKTDGQLPNTGAILRISQPLGQTTWKRWQVIRRDGKGKGFRPGEEYVLFLQWNPYLGLFTADAADTFKIGGSVVETPSETANGIAQRGIAQADFLARVRAAAATAASRAKGRGN